MLYVKVFLKFKIPNIHRIFGITSANNLTLLFTVTLHWNVFGALKSRWFLIHDYWLIRNFHPCRRHVIHIMTQKNASSQPLCNFDRLTKNLILCLLFSWIYWISLLHQLYHYGYFTKIFFSELLPSFFRSPMIMHIFASDNSPCFCITPNDSIYLRFFILHFIASNASAANCLLRRLFYVDVKTLVVTLMSLDCV